MKHLLLVRHAKSDWNDASLSDFDRPLNKRGKADAPVMAKRLSDKKITIDAFISSPAKRAKRTAQAFAEEYNTGKERIIFIDKLYGAEVNVFFDLVSNVDDKFNTIALFSHNPGITDFANQLTNTRINNIPTCGVFMIKTEAQHWSEFKDAEKEFLFFDSPKTGAD